MTHVTSIPMSLPTIEVSQPVFIPLPTSNPLPKPYTVLERTPMATNLQTKIIHNKSKPPPCHIPLVRNTKSKLHIKSPRVMELATNLQPYDVMRDLENLHPQIIMTQLIAIAPQCHTKGWSTMIRKKAKVVKANDITLSQDPHDPTINVTIASVLITRVQVDIGFSVNLTSMKTMEKLGLATNMVPNSIVLKMANHTHTNP